MKPLCDRQFAGVKGCGMTLRKDVQEVDMSEVLDELKAAGRALRRARRFTTGSITTLALGTAALMAVFTILNAVYLRPLPWRDGETLVRLYESEPGGAPYLTVAPVSIEAWR
jgi:hypothetical protein